MSEALRILVKELKARGFKRTKHTYSSGCSQHVYELGSKKVTLWGGWNSSCLHHTVRCGDSNLRFNDLGTLRGLLS